MVLKMRAKKVFVEIEDLTGLIPMIYRYRLKEIKEIAKDGNDPYEFLSKDLARDILSDYKDLRKRLRKVRKRKYVSKTYEYYINNYLTFAYRFIFYF